MPAFVQTTKNGLGTSQGGRVGFRVHIRFSCTCGFLESIWVIRPPTLLLEDKWPSRYSWVDEVMDEF